MNYKVILDSTGNVTVTAGDKSFAPEDLDGFSSMLITSILKEALSKLDGKPKGKARKKRKARANGKNYVYEGQTYSSKTDLGKAIDGEAKWPHKIAQAALDDGRAVEVAK